MAKFYLILLLSVLTLSIGLAQCAYKNDSREVSGIDYDIKLTLDTKGKKADCIQILEWTNKSPDTIFELRFYMYLNAFRDFNSTYLKDTGGKIFGRDIANQDPIEWGGIDITTIKIEGVDHLPKIKYIHPDDDNEQDQSVMSIQLAEPILPGERVEIEMNYVAKIPKTIARVGYGRDDYYLFVHWTPQPGVYEQDKNGVWGWNCHQFFQQTEFYAEFANYKVELTVPDDLVIGASGCKTGEVFHKNGTKTVSYDARDIVDFAWSAYPHFEEYKDTWKGVDITMLIPPEHCSMAPRYLGAIKNALDYFEKYLGKYPYPAITVVDPPMHALNSGFMEYPMLITCASFHYVPSGIRTIESLAIHEFSHQYFMGILASNEKEEAWLDEGFVTFFEDNIVDHYYGGPKASIFDILGYKSGNKEQSRLEYTSMSNLHDGPIARPGWEFTGNYKELIYAKTGTMLQTLRGLLGDQKMQQVMQHYYNKHKFTHPKEKDWIQAVKDIIGDRIKTISVDTFFHQCLHETSYCDYKVSEIRKNNPTEYQVKLERLGELFLPQELLITFMDGSTKMVEWDGIDKEKIIMVKSALPIVSAEIDPDKKIYLDINFINNSYTFENTQRPAVNYGLKAMSWVQHLIQSATFLF